MKTLLKSTSRSLILPKGEKLAQFNLQLKRTDIFICSSFIATTYFYIKRDDIWIQITCVGSNSFWRYSWKVQTTNYKGTRNSILYDSAALIMMVVFCSQTYAILNNSTTTIGKGRIANIFISTQDRYKTGIHEKCHLLDTGLKEVGDIFVTTCMLRLVLLSHSPSCYPSL